ncbi:MAG: hypothetical protein K8R41_08945 [Bacteroidales bacterium]|nr:hypothetical protein [Bacteroidales bacterium]
MKTIVITLALVLTFFVQFSFSNNLNNKLEEEKYINDIPFDTEEVVSNFQNSLVTPEFRIEEEEYINDIPFNIEEIYFDHLVLQYENENEINDIPFDTKEIAMKFNQSITTVIVNKLKI